MEIFNFNCAVVWLVISHTTDDTETEDTRYFVIFDCASIRKLDFEANLERICLLRCYWLWDVWLEPCLCLLHAITNRDMKEFGGR